MDKLWFSWEDHRRSRELAKAFGAEYIFLSSYRSRFIRYINLSVSTVRTLLFYRPSIVFCQNPSIVLASVLVIFKRLLNYSLIVDRHSNFKFEHQDSGSIIWRTFWFLSKYTVKSADLTIVTNKDLSLVCNSWGGKSAVLPDKIPDLTVADTDLKSEIAILNGNFLPKVVAITTFDSDEPISEMFEAARIISDEFEVYFTGNYKKHFSSDGDENFVPKNVTLLGFIPESSYRVALSRADVIMVLTSKDLILNCGAYEAVSLNVPLVIANTNTMTGYFYKGTVPVDLTAASIAAGIRDCYNKRVAKKEELQELRLELEKNWLEQFNEVSKEIESIRTKSLS